MFRSIGISFVNLKSWGKHITDATCGRAMLFSPSRQHHPSTDCRVLNLQSHHLTLLREIASRFSVEERQAKCLALGMKVSAIQSVPIPPVDGRNASKQELSAAYWMKLGSCSPWSKAVVPILHGFSQPFTWVGSIYLGNRSSPLVNVPEESLRSCNLIVRYSVHVLLCKLIKDCKLIVHFNFRWASVAKINEIEDRLQIENPPECGCHRIELLWTKHNTMTFMDCHLLKSSDHVWARRKICGCVR